MIIIEITPMLANKTSITPNAGFSQRDIKGTDKELMEDYLVNSISCPVVLG